MKNNEDTSAKSNSLEDLVLARRKHDEVVKPEA